MELPSTYWKPDYSYLSDNCPYCNRPLQSVPLQFVNENCELLHTYPLLWCVYQDAVAGRLECVLPKKELLPNSAEAVPTDTRPNPEELYG